MRRISISILTLATALTLAACGSDSEQPSGSGGETTTQTQTDTQTETSSPQTLEGDATPAPTDTYPDAVAACLSVSPEQITEILGAAGEATGSGARCTVEVAADKEVVVDVSTLDSAGYADVDEFVETKKDSSAAKAVGGLGDAAYVSTASGELTMVVGDQFIEIDVVLDEKSRLLDPTRDWSAEHEAAIAIASTVVDRAPVATS